MRSAYRICLLDSPYMKRWNSARVTGVEIKTEGRPISTCSFVKDENWNTQGGEERAAHDENFSITLLKRDKFYYFNDFNILFLIVVLCCRYSRFWSLNRGEQLQLCGQESLGEGLVVDKNTKGLTDI